MKHRLQLLALLSVGAPLCLLLLLPLASLFIATPPADLASGLQTPIVWPALKLSLYTTSVSLLVVLLLGTPLAWLLAQSTWRASRMLETLLQLPIVTPPAVAGVALLLAFGKRGIVGRFLPPGYSLAFSTGAVIIAEVFVSGPLFLQVAIEAFRRVDTQVVAVARTLGASPLRVFTSISVPIAAPSLVVGAALCWARSLGEFGATLMFAGNMEGKTQTLPLAIYSALEGNLQAAQALACVLVFVALSVLILVKALNKSVRRGGTL